MKVCLLACLLSVGLQSSALPSQTDWSLGSPPGVYAMEAKGKATLADGASLTLSSVIATPPGGGSVLASIPADSLRGRRIVFAGELQTRDVTGGASLWLRMDEGTAMLMLENGMADAQRGTTEWMKRTVSLPVPPETTRITFGLFLQGGGVATARSVRLEAAAPVGADAALPPAVTEVLDAAIALTKKHALRASSVDWSAVEPRVRALAAGAATTADAYPAIRYMLSRLGDRHSSLMPAAQTAMFASGAIPNPTPEIRSLPGGVGYISVPAYAGSQADGMRSYATRVHAEIGALHQKASCGFVIDLRGNGGGNMWPMLAGLQPFLGGGTVGTFEAPGTSTKWVAGRAVGVEPSSGLSMLESAWVAVITGPRTVSSGEAVTVAFRGRPRTRSFGQPTGGLSTSNSGFPLPDGATLLLTTAVFADRNGHHYGAAIEPDEIVALRDGSDSALAAAVAWLRRSSGCEGA
jgi:carboxyl-terminal processing protease